MEPLTYMALGQGAQALGRALGGLGGSGEQQLTGFGVGPDYFGQNNTYNVDEALIDPRFALFQATQGAGRLGTLLSRRAEQPFRLGQPVQQPVEMAGGFLTGPVALSATDPAHWNPRQELRSPGMHTGDPFSSFSKTLPSQATSGRPAEAVPGRGPQDVIEAGQTHPDFAAMEGGLALMGINRDPQTGAYNFKGTDPFNQQMFQGARGGQHRIPGSPQRPFGEGAESQRVGSQPRPEGGPMPGLDIRRRRGEWQSA